MILEQVMDHLEKDIAYFYVDIVDVKIMPNAITFFAESPADMGEHRYIRVTRYKEEARVEVHTDRAQLLDEVIAFLQNENVHTVYLLLEQDAKTDALSRHYSIEHQADHSSKDHGVYGIIRPFDIQSDAGNIDVKQPNENDVEHISALPNEEWSWLPQRIKRMNTNDMLIARKDGELAGYLISDSGIAGYRDIVIVYVHPRFRKQNVGATLVSAFARECEKRNEFAYYGTANSVASALLAQSLNVDLIREPNEVYTLGATIIE